MLLWILCPCQGYYCWYLDRRHTSEVLMCRWTVALFVEGHDSGSGPAACSVNAVCIHCSAGEGARGTHWTGSRVHTDTHHDMFPTSQLLVACCLLHIRVRRWGTAVTQDIAVDVSIISSFLSCRIIVLRVVYFGCLVDIYYARLCSSWFRRLWWIE